MCKAHQNRFVSCYDKILDELYILNSIVNIAKLASLEKEISGQYYGLSSELSQKLSAERNHYINIFSVLLEKINNIENLNISLEKELMLHNNADNSCR